MQQLALREPWRQDSRNWVVFTYCHQVHHRCRKIFRIFLTRTAKTVLFTLVQDRKQTRPPCRSRRQQLFTEHSSKYRSKYYGSAPEGKCPRCPRTLSASNGRPSSPYCVRIYSSLLVPESLSIERILSYGGHKKPANAFMRGFCYFPCRRFRNFLMFLVRVFDLYIYEQNVDRLNRGMLCCKKKVCRKKYVMLE